MFRNLSVFKAIIIAVVIFVLSAPMSEARLGQGGERKLEPFSSSSAYDENSRATSEIISSDHSEDEFLVTNTSEACNVPCANGMLGSITVCHQRGGEFIEICTEADAFTQHKQMGDSCGHCPTQ